MKAFTIQDPGVTAIIDIPEPSPASSEVLLQVHRVGFCGSDLSIFLGKHPLVTYPRIPGHEIAATVVETCSGVPDSIRPGMDVTVIPYTNCNICTSCLRGKPNACRYNQTLGVQRDGAMTEYITAPWQKLVMADGLGQNQLVLVEPLTIGFHAVERGRVTDNDIVMVLGCGIIGLGAIIRSSLRGAKVLAVDIDEQKLEAASMAGARYTINSQTQDLHQAVEELTGGNGPDVVFEAVGSPMTYRLAMEEVAFAGRVICIGYTTEDSIIPTRLFVEKELDVCGSRNTTSLDFIGVVKYMQEHSFSIKQLISCIAPMTEAGNALRKWADNPQVITKIIISIAPDVSQ